MFNRQKEPKPHALDETIEDLIRGIAGLDDGSEEQLTAVRTLQLLIETRNADIQVNRALPSTDTITNIAANLLGIGLILGFEKANVITTKSLSFVPRLKI